MKKHVSAYDLEKGLRIMWEVPNSMEVTQLSENLFKFDFKEEKDRPRILSKQPWNYRGSLILERIWGDECPSDFMFSTTPMWIQVHGLQIQAMNWRVGETLGALLGEVLEV